jgi:hypothetical protein
LVVLREWLRPGPLCLLFWFGVVGVGVVSHDRVAGIGISDQV